MGKVLPAKDQQEGPLGVMGQLYALVAAVVEYPEYFYRKASNCQNFLHGNSSPMTSPPEVITLSLKLIQWEEGDEHVLCNRCYN